MDTALAQTKDYRQLLKQSLEERKKRLGKSVSSQDMASYVKVQKTYLSAVLAKRAHLSEDQMYLSCKYLKIPELQQQYFSLLHQTQRSGCEERIEVLGREIVAIEKKLSGTDGHLNINTEPDLMDEYYLEPVHLLVHMYLTINSVSKDFTKITSALNINLEELNKIIDNLIAMRILEQAPEGLKILKETVHMNTDHKLFKAHKKLMRLKSLEKVNRSDDSYSLSVTFSADEATHKKIKAAFMDFLNTAHELVESAPAQEVYQLNFDLHGWK